ncbi:hypothetical protein JOD64_003273 [Micromonospora luteifusca]|uniref:Uncharacterized protein n=1 Tax=Micromonospora luteifusca TaxID=709860 RepID=A0ABS2LV42_9ACTN|nr:hypothetical protein [Micromonospora luteifusca]
MFSLTRTDGHLLSTDPARLDLDLVHLWLSTDAYWALDRASRVAGWAGGWPARSATTWPSLAYAGSCSAPTTHTRCTGEWDSHLWTRRSGGCSSTSAHR